jgi:hypothetical protein
MGCIEHSVWRLEALTNSFGNALGIDPAHRRNMTTSFTYRDLEAWKRGMDLVEQCYKLTASFPKGEHFALTSQIRRAAVSVPSNLAEGHCRRTT